MTETTLNPQEIAVKNLLVDASVVIIDGDAYRIMYCDDETFTADLEETDDGYPIPRTFGYNEVDLDRDMIYKLVLVNPK